MLTFTFAGSIFRMKISSGALLLGHVPDPVLMLEPATHLGWRDILIPLGVSISARWRQLSKGVVYGVIAGSVVAALLTSFIDLDAFVSTYFGGVQRAKQSWDAGDDGIDWVGIHFPGIFGLDPANSAALWLVKLPTRRQRWARMEARERAPRAVFQRGECGWWPW